jgi:hypothetical protein
MVAVAEHAVAGGDVHLPVPVAVEGASGLCDDFRVDVDGGDVAGRSGDVGQEAAL